MPSPAYVAARKLFDERRLDEARAAIQRALQRSPADYDLTLLMGGVQLELGDAAAAVYFLQRAATLSPRASAPHAALGEAFIARGDFASGEKSLRKAIDLDPAAYSPRTNLANVLIKRGYVGEAEQLLRRAVALRPERSEALNNLALLLLDMGAANEAADMVRARLRATPNDIMLVRCLANLLNYVDCDPAECAAMHFKFGQALWAAAAPLRSAAGEYRNDRTPDRRIRVAYLSPDFREHSVAYFIEPVLRAHDREHVEVIGLSTTRSPDAVTARLRSATDQWRDVAALPDRALVDLVRAERIDVLVDLAGLTHNHRLGALAIGMAPVQMSCIGYPNTTGIPGVNARIVDAVTDPPGSAADSLASEHLLRVPSPFGFSCYAPPHDSPDPALPAEDAIAFASFNVLSKVGPGVVAAWAQVLKQVPRATLILKSRSLGDDAVRRRYLAEFLKHDIDEARLTMLPPTASIADHLLTYQRVTVALDPFPYNGTTTTCEALWMGVPVVTLLGRSHAGRVSASILARVGLESLVATDVNHYVALAAEVAADRDRLTRLRRGLREQMRASPLCDGRGYTRRLEAIIREQWRGWCAGER